MKKILLLTSIFSMLFLASCGKEQIIEKTNSGTILVQTGSKIETQTGIITKNETIIKTETGSKNKELTNTGTVEKQISTEIINKRSLAIENFNIVLQENGKTINKLTTKASGQKECDSNDGEDGNKKFYIYTITNQNSDYGIVKREEHNCGAHYTGIIYFGIDLINNTELTELSIGGEIKTELENNIIKIIILDPKSIVDKVEDARVETSKEDIISSGYKLEGIDWVKTIDLKNEIPKEIKKEEKPKNVVVSQEKKLEAKYSNDVLIKNGFKLNNLGTIKEYYKEEITPESLEYGKGFTTRKTIYIEGNNVLDFEINNWGGQNLIINSPKINEVIDLGEYGYPMQAIFGGGVIITNLNTIKLVDKSQGINKVLWKK